jgi:hypothetical protein
MIHLFLDDSGKESQAGNPWVCMAGYLAGYDPLVELNGKWGQLLLRHGISEIRMKQLIPMTGMYENLGWDADKRDAVIQDFVQAINETRMSGVGVAVETTAWNKRKKEYPDLAWGTIQQFCLERVLSRVIGQMHDAGINETLASVFDTDPEFGSNRFGLFCSLMGYDRRAARRLGSITFAHAVYYPGLQAADLLVWETRKQFLQQQEGYQSTRRWRAMFTRMPHYHLEYSVGECWDDQQFEKAMPEIIEKFRRRPGASSEVVE